ncbi:beta family protein [Pedobacter sp. AW31-3R]|uniref:beta family protein n=1 Tax=Pedobacter sp. AW31-3R TaxID=3445781 RepID=UPI003FA0DC8E
MMSIPTYIPILRLRQEEKKVLTTFDFGGDIFPYVEIFKEFERLPPKPKPGKTKTIRKPKHFHETYLPTLNSIKSEKIFVDLPVHLKQSRKMKKEVLEFLRGVVANRAVRTDYLLSLQPLRDKIIPVISTYAQLTGEPNSIRLQAADLREVYPILAFRTSELTFRNDINQIIALVQSQDFLIVDLENYNLSDPDDLLTIQFMLNYLKTFDKCHIVLLRNSIFNTIKNFELNHGHKIEIVDNSLMNHFDKLGAHSFADYGGIKKDPLEGGGGISPGFIFYDAVDNDFYGYKGSRERELIDFETIIVPAVLHSDAAARMQGSRLDFLSPQNKGWKMLENIRDKVESGKNQGKFKRISMEHYLHCIKTKIDSGYFLF